MSSTLKDFKFNILFYELKKKQYSTNKKNHSKIFH